MRVFLFYFFTIRDVCPLLRFMQDFITSIETVRIRKYTSNWNF
jgi:hypothetical protein